ncbi:hypothetical protein BGX21_001474 [Mortierella sp. AD011]|nr:hypothetical protein BGX20_010226 [Mortierella sp. AD010]KAF9403633.1 hypothetical protein BGX21_001474 [Mortierella sp. AD011]
MSHENDTTMPVESSPTSQVASSQLTSSSANFSVAGNTSCGSRTTESSALGLTKSLAHTRSVGEEFADLKKDFKKLVMGMERLGRSLYEAHQISSEESSMEALKRSVGDIPGASRERTSRGGSRYRISRERYSSKFFTPRKPNWNLRVLDPRGVEQVESLDNIEMKESTKKCLKNDGITREGYLEKNILSQLVRGDDIILQIRGSKLENYVIYPIVEVLGGATPNVQIIVVVNRLEVQSSKSFLGSLQKHLRAAELDVTLHIVPQDNSLDASHFTNSTSDKPCVFITTPEMMARMRAEDIIRPTEVDVMVIYEAEYVLRAPAHVEAIQSVLDETQVCQVILAAHDGTDDVVQAIGALAFPDDTVIFSMDHVNIRNARHHSYTDVALSDGFIERAAKLSEDGTVVVICRDATESSRLRDRLANRAEILTISKIAESNGSICGLLITPQLSASVLRSRSHSAVKMILNISGATITPDRYLEMMASYMDAGQECEIVTWVRSQDDLKNKGFDAIGIAFQYVSSNSQ